MSRIVDPVQSYMKGSIVAQKLCSFLYENRFTTGLIIEYIAEQIGINNPRKNGNLKNIISFLVEYDIITYTPRTGFIYLTEKGINFIETNKIIVKL